ncbi:MAG: hypothetical protein ACYC6Q_07550 [Syntrophales bacterium]
MKKATSEHAPRLRTAMVILSFIVSFGVLGFTVYQAWLSRQGVSAQTWQGFTQQGNEISRIFVDHPDLRPYFYDGKPITKDDPNFNAVMAVSEMYLDFLDSFQDNYVFTLPGMATNGEFRLLWDRYFKDMFASSPALCAYAKEKQHWYSTDFATYAPTEPRSMQQGTSNKASEVTARKLAEPQR